MGVTYTVLTTCTDITASFISDVLASKSHLTGSLAIKSQRNVWQFHPGVF